MIASVLALVSSPAGALAAVGTTVRLSGADRFATANKVANTPVVTDESHFVLVNGNSYADGLSASALAGALDTDGAALLLTDGTALTTSTLTTMAGMSGTIAQGLKYVHLVGGTSVISAAIATQLTASGYVVTRISGANRYATADAVAAEVKAQNSALIGSFGGYRTAFLANGNGYADALAASGIAYDNKLPIYLTDGSTLSAGTSASMKLNKIQKVIVLGGTAVVSEAVKTAAAAVSTVVTTTRVSGADRYATATALADTVAAVHTNRRVTVVLVDGTNFPDGLAASQYAARQDATILLVNGSTLPATVNTWLTGKRAYVANIMTVGGTTAVPAAAVTAAKTAATKPAVTATISKITDNGTIARVTFSERVVASEAETESLYSVTTKAGVTTGLAGTCTYTWTAATSTSVVNCVSAAAMAPGSTFTVTGGTIASYADAAVHVSYATYVQVADATVPTATIVAYAAAVDQADKVWVTFSSAPHATAAPSTFVDADIVSVSQVTGGTASVIDTCNAVTTTVWACDTATAALVAGDMVKIAAGKFGSGTATPVLNTSAFSTIAVTDITGPKLLTATYTAPVADTGATSQAKLNLVGDGTTLSGSAGDGSAISATAGDVLVTALATGAYAGKAGNAVTLTTAIGAADTCTFTAATKTILVTTEATEKAPTIADACNANAAFAAAFEATSRFVAGSYAMTNLVVTADRTTSKLEGGKNKFRVTLTFSEPLGTFAEANIVATTNCATSCVDAISETLVTALGAEATQEQAGVITMDVLALTTPSSGLDKITVATAVKDRNGVALVSTASANVVYMMLAG
jgi:putative cell wall-binding protein